MESKSQYDWQDWIQILYRRRWFFIIPLFLIFILSIVASFVLPKTYEAKATILVEEDKIVNPLLNNLAVSTSVGDRLHKLQEEILSWPRLLLLVEELDLNKDVRTPLDLEGLILNIRKQITLRMKGRDIITISYQGDEPKTTQEVVNTLCDILIRKNIMAQNAEADSAIAFIEEQLKTYKNKLELSEEALRKFKETYGLQMPLATQINEDLATLQAELTNALVDCTEEHPRVIELRRRIESLKEKRSQEILEASKQMDSGESKDYVDIAESIPKQEQELARLVRDRQVNEDIYAMLLERLQTASISKQLESSENKTKFKIIEPARLPLTPVKPNKFKVDLLGLVLGGMAGIGSVYLMEFNDKSFKKPEELKELFDLPVLGSISKIITEQDVEKKKVLMKKFWRLSIYIIPLLIILTIIIIKVAF